MSQAKRILDHLKAKGTITNAQAHNLYGVRHLPSVIRNIKKTTPIYDWWEEGRNRFNKKCHWKVYSSNEPEKETA